MIYQPSDHDADTRPVLLCFDGSDDATRAIERAGELLGPRSAIVLTVSQPIETWEPYDPSPLSTLVAMLGSKALKLDELATELASDDVDRGLGIAQAAGFRATGRIAHGKPWRAICDAADELDASVIVVGARGRSPVQSALLGGVSSAVTTHAHRPVLVVRPGERATSPAAASAARVTNEEGER
jgi:nucleotide-binding universal stress UspA family protein